MEEKTKKRCKICGWEYIEPLGRESILKEIEEAKKNGKRIYFCNECFIPMGEIDENYIFLDGRDSWGRYDNKSEN